MTVAVFLVERLLPVTLIFFHANILKYCNRPWLCDGDLDADGEWISRDIARARSDEMDEYMINVWNDFISPSDTVWHLGDFCFAPRKGGEAYIILLLERLNGKIHLIKGNHDHAKKHFWERHGVDYYPEGYYITPTGIMLSHYPTKVERRDDYQDSHKSIRIKNSRKYIYDKNKCFYLFYGHVHNSPFDNGPHSMNVGVDVTDFKPIHVNLEATCEDELFSKDGIN